MHRRSCHMPFSSLVVPHMPLVVGGRSRWGVVAAFARPARAETAGLRGPTGSGLKMRKKRVQQGAWLKYRFQKKTHDTQTPTQMLPSHLNLLFVGIINNLSFLGTNAQVLHC